ncbi:uncharacterized protein LDX57_005896 [Aspergillus melleus]|uniref:uncharacterized protein n=1 Tax=Aspergillus melleus TaxID=138277 RepID=UPI001E8E0902|nr:uncharacterized protein LDX57_005896 [Aspergillus melleus]KAH8428191.1 hypothetical protein LDX57_005896 [Aspergillus melleus]
MFGQILIGFAQPFCLSAPTRYSDLWFSDQGRTSATALATLANPLGAALGQLIDSFWAEEASEIPDMVLYISVIVRVPPAHRIFGFETTDSNNPQGHDRIPTFILSSRQPTHAAERLVRRYRADTPPPGPQPAAAHAGVLAHSDPLLRLRRLLQQRLVTAQPDPLAVCLQRNRGRHRRRHPHRRRPDQLRHHLAHHRPLQALPRHHPGAGPHCSDLLHRADLRPVQPLRHRTLVRRSGPLGRRFVRSPARRPGVPRRDHVSVLA